MTLMVTQGDKLGHYHSIGLIIWYADASHKQNGG